MTKMLFAILSCAVVVVLVYNAVKCGSKQSKLAQKVRLLLSVGAVSVAGYTIIFLTDSYLGMSIGNCIFFAGMDWLCYAILSYAVEYTKYRESPIVPTNRFIRGVILAVVTEDSLSMLANIYFEHAMKFTTITYHGEPYLQFDAQPRFEVHLGICYLLFGAAIVIFVRKIYTTAYIYKKMYGYVLAALAGAVAVNGAFLIYKPAVDISIYTYAAAAILLTHFTFHYVPLKLEDYIQRISQDEQKDLQIMFDNEDHFLYMNQSMALFLKDTKPTRTEFEQAWNWEDENRTSAVVMMGEARKIYVKEYKRFHDKKNRYMGCYYVMHNITEERAQQEKYRYMATHDALTGVYNREYFMECAAEFMHENPQEQFLIVCSDIRQFKMINEIFGTETGDRILQTIANEMNELDDHNRVYGRIAGDSFALCIPSKNFNETNYLMHSGSTLHIKDINFPIVNHIGIYEVEDVNMSVASMCDRAMLAIGMIKDNVQQEIAYYDDHLRKELLREQETLKGISQAFEERQFTIYIQPQFNHRTGDIVGGEVLVRWVHPQKGVIPPQVFIPVMEQRGLISRLDRYVWRMACELLKDYEDKGEPISLSVNISPRDFYYYDVYREFMTLVHEFDLNPSRLKLELTETAVMIDVPKQVALIEKLQAEGFVVEMDDFGSGYSSLNTLKDIPVDILKLDMKFMAQSKNAQRSEDIIRMVIGMADKLHMPVIAEGVETKAQADSLGEMGCDIIQGYYYSKPVPVAAFDAMLAEHPYKELKLERKNRHDI